MAGWFGHTQTVATISKAVATAAGGIIGLETNLSNFMKKVMYYEGFFQRSSEKLPEEVNYAAKKLFRRCYEYREQIREELQSSAAYVADAGRWVIGMEDWNTKMEKRMNQISELVLLANSLLAEYAVTGQCGAKGAIDELTAYLNVITSTIVLQDDALFHDSLKSKQTSSKNPNSQDISQVEAVPIKQSYEASPILQHAIPIEMDSPEDEDRLNPFNIQIDAPTVIKQSQPMAIPRKPAPPAPAIDENASRSSSNSFTSDYCNLEREYGDELNEMTSFSSTTALRKERHPSPQKPSGGRPKPYENAVYDLTVSFDFQKERTSNPFVSKTFAMERRSSKEDQTIVEEDHMHEDDLSPRQLSGGLVLHEDEYSIERLHSLETAIINEHALDER